MAVEAVTGNANSGRFPGASILAKIWLLGTTTPTAVNKLSPAVARCAVCPSHHNIHLAPHRNALLAAMARTHCFAVDIELRSGAVWCLAMVVAARPQLWMQFPQSPRAWVERRAARSLSRFSARACLCEAMPKSSEAPHTTATLSALPQRRTPRNKHNWDD